MSKVTVTYKIKAKKRKPEKKPDAPPPEKSSTRPVSRAARMLAVAHYVERLVEQGTVKSYAEAARQLGVSRARMSQILNLLNLPIPVQEALLLGDLHLSERRDQGAGSGGGMVKGRGQHDRIEADFVLLLLPNHDDNVGLAVFRSLNLCFSLRVFTCGTTRKEQAMKRLTKADFRGVVAVVALLAFADAAIAEEMFSVNIWSTGRPGSRGGIWGDEGSEDPTDPNRDPDIDTVWLDPDEEAGLWETDEWNNYQQIPFTSSTAPMEITGSEGSLATIEVVQMRNSGTYTWNQVRDDSDAESVPNATLLGSLIRGTEFDDANGGGDPFPARIVDVEVTNLPFESYDVVVYLGTELGRGPGGTIRVNSEIPADPTDLSGLPFNVVDGEPDGTLIEIVDDFDTGNYILYEGLEDETLKIQVWGDGFNHVGIAGLQIIGTGGPPPNDRFLRGDCNADGSVNIADGVCILNWLFSGVADPGCVATTNTNGDDTANISDATYLLNHLFSGGPAPVAPFPDCGPSTLEVDKQLGCANPPDCQ